jgi:hypothetical protein
MSILDDSLKEALAYTKLERLPREIPIGSKFLWVRAIALVERKDGLLEYALVESDTVEQKVKKTFGPPCALGPIRRIFPFFVLESGKIPVIDSDEAIKHYCKKSPITEYDAEEMLDKTKHTFEEIRANRKILRQAIFKDVAEKTIDISESEEEIKKDYEKQREKIQQNGNKVATRKTKRGKNQAKENQ